MFCLLRPAGCQCDKMRILAQWQRSVALSEALDPFHWAMYSALHWRISKAIEMGHIEVHLFFVDDFDIYITMAN